MTKRIAVTGATGYIGKFVVSELLRQGVTVRALARPTSDRRGFSSGIEWILGDLSGASALDALVQNVDAVVHLAYQHVPGRYRGGEGDDLAGWLAANLNGTLQLLLSARAARVSQFIFLSSRAVFSRTEQGRVLDETHPTSPDTHYGAYKVAVEAMLRSFTAVEGMLTTSVRSTGVYGIVWPVERSKWWDLIQAAVAGDTVASRRGGTEVHGADLARTIWALIEQPQLAPDIVHVSDLYVTHRQIVALAQQFAGRSGPLPPPPDDPPRNVLVCPRLVEFGITLGGEPQLKATVAELVNNATRNVS